MAVKKNEFPTKLELERISILRKYHSLYENEQMAVLGIHDIIKNQYKDLKDMVYLAHALPARITEFYGDFVQGDVERMRIVAPNSDVKDQEWIDSVVYENDLKEKVSDFAELQSEFGFCVLHGWVDESQLFHIESVPGDQSFPQPDGSWIFATYKNNPEHPGELLLHVQHYQLKDGHVVIEHQAFIADQKGVAIQDYPLEKMGALVGRTLLPEEIIEIDELPIKQADNGRKMKVGIGKSDYSDILPQLAEVNERATHVSTQLLKNLDAKMKVPASAYDENGKLRYTEAFVVETKDDPVPEFIINSNPLMADLREHLMTQLKFIELITAVPMWALTRGAGVERVESLRIQLFGAIRKTLKKRAKIRRAILDMIRIGAKMTGQSESLKSKDIILEFGDPLPVDELQQVQVESSKITSGLTSKKSSMKRIENYTDAEAQAELELIKSEDQIAGIGNSNNAPAL